MARFAHLVDMHTNVISHEGGGKLMEMVVPSRGIWGTAGIGGLNIDMAVESEIVGVLGVVIWLGWRFFIFSFSKVGLQ